MCFDRVAVNAKNAVIFTLHPRLVNKFFVEHLQADQEEVVDQAPVEEYARFSVHDLMHNLSSEVCDLYLLSDSLRFICWYAFVSNEH